MALADKLNVTRKYPRSQVGMDAWYADLPEGEKTAVDAALDSDAWAHTELMEIFESEGAPVPADTTFGKWRRAHGTR